VGRRTPCAAEHHHKSKTHSGDDGAREEQPLDAVLDRVQDHEGENEPQHEQEQRAQQRMPKSRFDSLAQLNHGRDGTRLTGGRPSTGTPVHGAEPSSRHVSVRTRYACPAPAEAFSSAASIASRPAEPERTTVAVSASSSMSTLSTAPTSLRAAPMRSPHDSQPACSTSNATLTRPLSQCGLEVKRPRPRSASRLRRARPVGCRSDLRRRGA